jgi:hypothetical protein
MIAPSGRLAQLVRAPPLQGGSHRFESCSAHWTDRLLRSSGFPPPHTGAECSRYGRICRTYWVDSIAAARMKSDKPLKPLRWAVASKSDFSSAVSRTLTCAVRWPDRAGAGGLSPISKSVATFLDAPAPKVPLGTAKTGYYPGVTR